MNKFMFRRYTLFVVALLILSIGIAIITRALLGTSPITSPALVLSMLTPWTMGQWTIIFNCILVFLELPFLTRSQRKADRSLILMQLPVSMLFGSFIDLGLYMSSWIVPQSYIQQIFCLLLGCVVLAIGIALEVKANVALASCDYFITVVSRRFKFDYGYTKLGVDITLVTTAILMSVCFLHQLAGVREGTLIAAIIVGPIIHFVNPYCHALDSWLGLQEMETVRVHSK